MAAHAGPFRVVLFDPQPLAADQPPHQIDVVTSLEAFRAALAATPWDAAVVAYPIIDKALAALSQSERALPVIVLCRPHEESAAYALDNPVICDILPIDTFRRLPYILARELRLNQLQDRIAAETRYKELLRRSEARFREVIEDFSDMILITDDDHIIRFANHAMERVLGFAPLEAIGKSLLDFVHPDDQSMLREILASKSELRSVEHRMHGVNGDWESLETTAQYMTDPAGHGAVILHLRSVTQRKRAEQAARESDILYRSLFEHMLNGLVYCRMEYDNDRPVDFVYLDTNQAFEKQTGLKNVIGRRATEVMPGVRESDPQVMELHGRVAKTGQPEHFETYVAVLDRWFDASVYSPQRGYFVSVFEDITARKQTEAALQAANATLERKVTERTAELQFAKDQVEAIINNNLDGIVLVDAGGVIQRANTAFEMLLGCEECDYIGQPLFKFIQADDQRYIQAALSERTSHHIEVQVLCADGTTLYTEIGIGPVKSDGFVCTIHNITDRKSFEQQLRYFASLQEYMSDAVITTDMEGNVQSWNRAAETIYGWTSQEVLGRHLADFVQTEYPKGSNQDESHQKLREKGSWHGEVIQRRKDGRELHILSSVDLMRDENDTPIGMVGVNHDLTDRIQAEEALRKSELRYRLVAENISDIVVRTNVDGTSDFVSPSAKTITGYDPEEIIGKPLLQFIHPDDAALLEIVREHTVATGTEEPTLTFRMRHKDGYYLWMEANTHVLLSEDGKFIGSISSPRDVTERKRAEAELRRREQWYRTLINNLPRTTVFLFDRDFRYFVVEGSDPLYPGKIMEGKTIHEILSPEQLDTLRPGYEAALRGETARIERTTNGHIFDGQFAPIREEDGSISAGILVVRDVTEERQSEQHLRESEARFRGLVEAAPVAILIADQNGIVSLINKEVEKLFGYQPKELIGYSLDILVPDDRRGKHQDLVTRYAESPHICPRGHSLDMAGRRKDGTEFPVEIELSYVRTQDGIQVVSFIIDLTERKKTEIALRQSLVKEKELGDLKSRFVSMASHEFRTPLANISALTDTIIAYRTKLSEEQITSRLSKIQDQIAQLKAIMDDVLQLARMQARRAEFVPTLLDLDSVARSVMDEFQSRATHHFVYHCDDALHAVMMDRKLIRQILSNLMSNAIKYSPDGNMVIVHLAYERGDLRLSVQDEGIGIPVADLPHLFEPFHRASNVGAVSGTGLGLIIAKEAVELHGGTISVDSTVGVGTTFTIHIPLNIQEGNNNDKDSGN